MEKEKVFAELDKEENRGLYVEFFMTKEPKYTIDDFRITEREPGSSRHKADLMAFRVVYRKDDYAFTDGISIDSNIFYFTYDGKKLSFLNRPVVMTDFSQCYINENNFDKKTEFFKEYVKNFIPDLDFSRPLTLKQIMRESEKTLEKVFREHGFEVFKDKMKTKKAISKSKSTNRNKKQFMNEGNLSL